MYKDKEKGEDIIVGQRCQWEVDGGVVIGLVNQRKQGFECLENGEF